MPALTFARFSVEYIALNSPPILAKNSTGKVKQVLRELFEVGFKTTKDLTPALIARWLSDHLDRADTTNKGLLGYISPLCDYAFKMRYVRINPFTVRREWLRVSEPEDIVRHHPAEAIDRVIEHTAALAQTGGWIEHRLHALAATVAWTGLRKNEALNARVEAFDLPGRVMFVSAKGHRLKTRKSAAPIGIPDDLAEILGEWFRTVGSACAFPNQNRKTPWTGGSQGKRPLDRLKAVAEEVGVEDFTFLSLRHSWATHAEILWGMPEGLIKRQLRHTSIRTQGHYRHPDLPNLVNAVRSIGFKPKAAVAPHVAA